MDNITTWLAIYGAVLSTVSITLGLVLGIRELRKYKPNVKLMKTNAVFTDSNGKVSESFISITAENHGLISITITGAGWFLKNKSRDQQLNPYLLTLPYELKPNKTVSFYYACRWFAEMKRVEEITGSFFQNELGKTWVIPVPKREKANWLSKKSEGYLVEWNPTLKK